MTAAATAQPFDGLLPLRDSDWVDLPSTGLTRDDRTGITRVSLSINEPTGLPRDGHPVTSGLPLGEGELYDESHVRLLDDFGRQMPLQTQMLARWPDESVKWLLLDFQLDLDAAQTKQLTLEYGAPGTRTARHPSPVNVREFGDTIEVSSGAMSFRTGRGAIGLVQSIQHDDRDILREPLAAFFTARSIDRTGAVDGRYVAHVDELTIEERGPLRAVLRLSGWHRREGDGRPSMPFVVRLTAWAGSAVLGIQHTFIVSEEPLDVMFRGIGLKFASAPRASAISALIRDHQRLLPKEIVQGEHQLCVYLWPESGLEMDLRPALVRRPPDFDEWDRKYPGAFDNIEGGKMTQQEAYDAFMCTKSFPSIGDQRCRSGKGVAKTHDIFVGFAENSDRADRLVAPFDRPLFSFATPTYYASTAALGRFHPYDPQNFGEIERAVETHFNWIVRHRDEWSKWHGIFDYGDTMSVFDRKRGEWWIYDGGRWGWLNGEVNADGGLFVQALRTADRRWLDYAETAARHRVDCDQLHYHDEHPQFVGGMHRHYMTEHWSGQIDGGHLWIDGGIYLYYLFGNRRGLECAIEGADWAIRFGLPYLVKYADTSRETNNCLRALSRVYEATREPRFHEAAEAIVQGYLCCFDEDGVALTLEQCKANLDRTFVGSKWRDLPDMLPYTWHGHSGYGYLGYLAPAIRWWWAVSRSEAAAEINRRFDIYAFAIQGDPGQYFGERYLETNDPRYLTHLVRELKKNLIVPFAEDGKGDEPGSFEHPRVDYLSGLPYVLAALYQAREKLNKCLLKTSALIVGYRAAQAERDSGVSFKPIDFAPIANANPGSNPFRIALEQHDAEHVAPLRPNQIGFQPSNGTRAIRKGYLPLSAYHTYPATEQIVVTNQQSPAGMPLGACVEFAGIPFRFLNPLTNENKGALVLGKSESATIPIRASGRALHVLGHVHGRKGGRQISQFTDAALGFYDIRYASGKVETIELRNGVHFDSVHAEAYATGVTHAANFDWNHAFANLTLDQFHLNIFRLPLDERQTVDSITIRAAGDEDWGLLFVAATLESEGARDDGTNTWKTLRGEWRDLGRCADVSKRRDNDARGVRLFAPFRFECNLRDGNYEIELTLSGDPQGKPRLRIESRDAQLVADYCIAGQDASERIRFFTNVDSGKLTLDFVPAPNASTGRHPTINRYGTWRSPSGNFVRVEQIRVRPTTEPIATAPSAKLRYGWLRPDVTGEASRGGLVVDHRDELNAFMQDQWTAGGFRVDLTDGRYRVRLDHTTYSATAGSVFVDVFANGVKMLDAVEVDDTAHEFIADALEGKLELTWSQPKVASRCPRYAIRSIVLERLQ